MAKYMIKVLQAIAVFIFVSLAIYSPKGFSQVPPMVLCNGGWIPQGTPCGGASGMPFGQVAQGVGGITDAIGKCEIVGGVAGGVGGALIGGKDHRGLGAVLGAVAGAFAGHKVCDNDTQQVTQQHRCAPGKVWAKLNWKGENGQPDHPQHGSMVCMDPNDPHRS